MALLLTTTLNSKSTANTEFGTIDLGQTVVNLDDVYVKIETISGDKKQLMVFVSFKGFNVSGSKTYTFSPDMNGPNIVKQAYLHLKTLPEFADAVDC